jgi:hypothetical protein
MPHVELLVSRQVQRSEEGFRFAAAGMGATAYGQHGADSGVLDGEELAY